MAEKLKLEYGKPETIAFKYDAGRNVEGHFGPQVAFTAITQAGQNQILYLDPEPASDVERTIQQLGIRPREYFRIVKVKQPHGGTTINVERIAAPATIPTIDTSRTTASAPASYGNNAPAPVQHAAPATTEPAQISTAPAMSPASAQMASAMCAALDAIMESEAYASRRGRGLTFSEESVRAIGLSIYIGNQQRARQ